VTYLTFPVWFFSLWDLSVEFTTWFYVFPHGAKDPDSTDLLDNTLTQLGNLLRLGRFVCIGFLSWYLACGEYPEKTWVGWIRRRIWGSASALARET
jgi:hypothetical protein